jgi:hypothetical protein
MASVGAASMQDRLIGRVKNILTTPKTEWPVIAAEPATVADIYKNYLIILAALPAIAAFIKMSLIGVTIPFLGTVRTPIASGITSAVLQYVMSLAAVFIVALIIDALAPTFGGQKNQTQAVKTSAYAYTAGLVGGIFVIVPALGWLLAFLASLYGFYLLYLGLPVTMKAAQDKAVVYTAAVAVVAIVVMLVLGMIVGTVTGANPMMMGALGGGGATQTSNVQFDADSPLGALAQFGQRMEQAGQQLEQAQQSGDAQAQQDALGNLFGAALGGGNSNVESLTPDQMRGFVPETLAGLARTNISTQRNEMFGIQVSTATASFSDGNRDIDLEITDLGGAQGLTALAGWAGVEQNRESDTGYERTSRANGQIIHEVYDRPNDHSEYTVIVGNRFSVQVDGDGTVDQMKAAMAQIDLARLVQMGAAR